MNFNSIVMWETLPNNAGLRLFQDWDFAGDLEDSKYTSGGTLCIFGNHTFVPIKWDVQETNCCFAQLHRSEDNFS